MISMFMAGSMDDAANIKAINTYIMTQPIHTSKAGEIRNKWLKWHDNLSYLEKTFTSQETYDVARNIRNEFNTANAITPAQKAAVEAVKQTGLTSEELRGETKRTTAEGNYLAPEPDLDDEEEEPWIPTKTKVALGVSGVVLLGLAALKRIYIDPFLSFKRG